MLLDLLPLAAPSATLDCQRLRPPVLAMRNTPPQILNYPGIMLFNANCVTLLQIYASESVRVNCLQGRAPVRSNRKINP